jgi:hypothetical protein
MEEAASLDRIIESDWRIALVDTAAPETLMEQCKRITLTTGRAIYGWNPDNGLYRLGVNHIFIPRTRTAMDVLSYINSSRHYGIYLLGGLGDALGKPAVERQLVNLATRSDGVRRLLLITGHGEEISPALEAHAVRLSLREQAQKVG